MLFSNDSCVKIGSENVVLGLFVPCCHDAGEDIHHTCDNLKFAFLSSVFASSSVCVMTKGYSILCHSCHEFADVPNHADFHRIAHRLETERDSHKIAVCVQRKLQVQGRTSRSI